MLDEQYHQDKTMSHITIKIQGLEELIKDLDRLPKEIDQAMKAAGKEAAEIVLSTEGVRTYPPETAANRAPAPFYIRGKGTQTKSGNRWNSERYGSQWTVKATTPGVTISNRASYGIYLADENKQAAAMADKGWVKLIDAARDQEGEITKVYQAWIDRAIKKIGL
jgi:hypothetical protein